MRMQIRAARILASVLVLISVSTSHAQDAAPYAKIAPIEQYLMDRDSEIAMARSAAPDAIAKDATILVLTRHGFGAAVKGKNGWTCIVDRGWGGMLDYPEFWNPKIRAAGCLNPAASRSVLPYDLKRAELILAGRSKEEIIAATQTAIAKKELPMLEPGAMSYMMSKTNYLFDQGEHAMSHVMFLHGGRRSIVGSQPCQLSGHGRQLLVFLPRHLPATQDLPSGLRLPHHGGQMVGRHTCDAYVSPTSHTILRRPSTRASPRHHRTSTEERRTSHAQDQNLRTHLA